MRNANPPGRIASLLRRRKSVPTSRPPRPRRGALLTLAVAVAAAAAAVPIVSASASSSGAYLASQDGLGIQPGKIKHVWLIILENKSYDATLHRPEQQHLPVADAAVAGRAAEELLRHRPLQPRQLHLDGQRPGDAARHAGRLPVLRPVLGHASTRPGSLRTNPNYGQMASAAGPERGRRDQRLRLPGERADAVQPARRRPRELEGLRPGPRQPRRERRRPHDAGTQYCGAPYATPGPTGSTAQPNPGSANATDQYVPKHFPFPWFESILQSGDCNAAAHRQPVRSDQRPLPRPAERGDDAGVQLDLAEQLQRRPRRGLPRQQPLGRLLRTRTRRTRRSTTPAACTRPTCSSSTSSPRSRRRRRSRTAA